MKAFWGFITLDICQQRFYEAAFSCNHHFIFHSIISSLRYYFFPFPSIHPMGKKPAGSENFELVAGTERGTELKKIRQEPKKLVKFFTLYLDNG